MSKDEFALLTFGLADRPIAFIPAFARAGGGVKAGLFLSQLYYWSDKGKQEDGWIYKDWREWKKETCLSQDEQRQARSQLIHEGLIEESDVRTLGLDRFKSTKAYRINFDMLLAALKRVSTC